MQNNTVENNNITLYSGYGHAGDNGLEEDSGYAVVIEDRAYGGFMYGLNQGSDVYNNRIINNNITTYGNNPYSIEHYGGKNTTIAGNNITAVESNPSAIAFTGVNSVIENNTIVSLAQTNQTGTTVDHFPAVSTGIYLQYSYNTTVKNNVITTENCTSLLANSYDSLNISKNIIQSTDDYGVTLIRVNNSFVTENDIQSRTFKADASVSDNNGNNNVIENNTPAEEVQTYSLKVDTTEFNIGEPTAISASIYMGDEVATDINGGKVVFKVNGKTLKDANGKVIYAKVINGTATITDYEVPSTWAKDNITIQAVYSGSSQCEALRTSANLTVTKDTPSITSSDVTASKGETVTLTATVSDGNAPVNVGKVVFKVNGKTVKDANGKVVYAKVVNGMVSVEYTIPENMKAGSYNITVSFTAPGYDKLVDTKTLTVSA